MFLNLQQPVLFFPPCPITTAKNLHADGNLPPALLISCRLDMEEGVQAAHQVIITFQIRSA